MWNLQRWMQPSLSHFIKHQNEAILMQMPKWNGTRYRREEMQRRLMLNKRTLLAFKN